MFKLMVITACLLMLGNAYACETGKKTATTATSVVATGVALGVAAVTVITAVKEYLLGKQAALQPSTANRATKKIKTMATRYGHLVKLLPASTNIEAARAASKLCVLSMEPGNSKKMMLFTESKIA